MCWRLPIEIPQLERETDKGDPKTNDSLDLKPWKWLVLIKLTSAS